MTRVPVVGQTYTFGASAVSQADTDIFQAAATIAAGDFQRSINGAGFVNMDNIPTVTPAAGKRIQFVVSAAETTAAGDGGEIYIVGSDAADNQWQDVAITLRVFAADMPIATEIQSGLATSVALATAQADLDDPDQYKADVSALATAASIVALPAAVWAYANRTLTSVSAIVSAIAAAIWAWASRTLTQAAAEVEAAVAGPDLAITRGDTYEQQVTGLGDISARTKLWLTVKRSKSDDDDESIIQIEETTGLVYLNSAEAETPTDASLTVDDEVAGDVTIRLKPALTAVLVPTPKLHYDWQVLEDVDVRTIAPATVSIHADVTRAIE